MKSSGYIDLSIAGIGGKLVKDYFAGDEKNKLLYDFTPDLTGISDAIEARKKIPVDRKLLHQALLNQYAGIKLHEKVKLNIDLLLEDTTYTITTGHQLNLFTGPLYFIYKIASVLSLCTELSALHPGKNFVPVYWMNSEDHDFKEINHFFIHEHKFSWEEELEKYGPVGRMQLTGMKKMLDEVQALHDSKNIEDKVLDFTIKTYRESKTLAEAHRKVTDHFFREHGLVILDQDDASLKTAFIPAIKEEIFQQSSIPYVEETNAYLEKNGYKPQVFTRDINFFYTGNGTRERIVKEGEQYALADHSIRWTAPELEKEIETNPFYFSPNVVTRPLYQEQVLPNLAYIGGPAEVAYWMQYKTNFKAHNTFFPVLLLRDCFLVISEKSGRKLKSLGILLEDMFKPYHEIVNAYIQTHHQESLDVSGIEAAFNIQYEELLNKVKAIDPALDKMVEAARTKATNQLERVHNKMNKHLKEKSSRETDSIKKVYDEIFPGGTLQERQLNIFSFSPRIKAIIDFTISSGNCLDPRLKIIED